MFQSIVDTIRNNTTGFGEIIRQAFFTSMALGWLTLSQEQFNAVIQLVSLSLAFIAIKTTIATNKVEKRVEEQVAHREMAGTTGTGDGLTPSDTPGPATPGLMGILVMMALIGSLVACGPKPPPGTSPEGVMALRATQVMAALRATLPEIKKHVCVEGSNPMVCLKPGDALVVVGYIETAGDYAVQLGSALRVVDGAKTVTEHEVGMVKARTLLTHIHGLLASAQIAPESAGARLAVVQLMGTVTTLLISIAAF